MSANSPLKVQPNDNNPDNHSLMDSDHTPTDSNPMEKANAEIEKLNKRIDSTFKSPSAESKLYPEESEHFTIDTSPTKGKDWLKDDDK